MERHLRIGSIELFEYQNKESGFVLPGASHPLYELCYVDWGPLYSVADGQTLELAQGDMVLYAPGQWHMQHAPIDTAPHIVCISFHLAEGDISSLVNRKITVPQQAADLLRQMLWEQENRDPWSDNMILACLELALLILLRKVDAPAEKLQTAYALRSENNIVHRAQQYVSNHIREKLSVPLVARNTDVSPSYLTALFHKHLGISPAEYIRRVKLQESKQLIREGKLNFTEIAAALQYSTVHHFSRQFKEKFGITPTEYAKSLR